MTTDIPWRYARYFRGKSLYEILKEIQKPLKLSEGDIQLILTRTRNLKDKTSTRGRSDLGLILTCTYLFINWIGANKLPININKFISICNVKKYYITKNALLNNVKVFKEARIFPVYTNITELFEGYWPTIKQYFKLEEAIKTEIIEIIENNKITSGRSRNVILAGSIYYITRKYGLRIYQSQLASFFGITEVSIRNFNRVVREILE